MQRAINRSLVLRQLQQNRGVSRAELAAMTGLNKATITAVVQELLDAALVVELGTRQGTAGRPSVELALHPSARLVAGVQVDAEHLRAVLTNLSAEVLQQWQAPIVPARGPAAVQEQLLHFVGLAADYARAHDGRLLGLGLALPGMVAVDTGLLLRADNLGWHNIAIRDAIARQTHLPTYIEKSTNAALLAELYFGSARGVDNALYLEVSDRGIGGALLLHGDLYGGEGHLAGEVGHIRVIPDGPQCSCGGRGCWETVASEAAIVRHAHQVWARESAEGGPVAFLESAASVRAAAQQGVPLAREALRQTGDWLGLGLANLVNVLAPAVVIVGGDLPLTEPLVWDAMIARFGTQTLSQIAARCQVVAPQFGVNETAMGGVALVLRQLLWHPAIVPLTAAVSV